MDTKKTQGYVRQFFNENGELIKQEFIASNDEIFCSSALVGNFYSPFEMVQPENKIGGDISDVMDKK